MREFMSYDEDRWLLFVISIHDRVTLYDYFDHDMVFGYVCLTVLKKWLEHSNTAQLTTTKDLNLNHDYNAQ
jgi:hypothetical protein